MGMIPFRHLAIIMVLVTSRGLSCLWYGMLHFPYTIIYVTSRFIHLYMSVRFRVYLLCNSSTPFFSDNKSYTVTIGTLYGTCEPNASMYTGIVIELSGY